MLSNIERTIACWSLAVAIVAGYFVPGLSEMLAPYSYLSLLIMIVLSLVPMGRLDFQDIVSMDWKVWQIVLWQLFVLPALIVSAAHLARFNWALTTLMVVTASAGSLFASPTFAELLQVNKQKALQCMILSTFLMPVSYFIFFTIVLQSEVNIDIGNFLNRCVTFLVIPLGIFLVYMGIARCLPTRLAEGIEYNARRLTIVTLVIFGVGIMGPARDLMWSEFGRFILYLSIVIVLGAGMAYLTAIVMFRQGMSDALTASIVSGFRNVGLGFVLLSGVTSEHTAAYVGISQIPIFFAPLVLSFLVKAKHQTLGSRTAPALA
jgi:large-conductance mechanosensitive channel